MKNKFILIVTIFILFGTKSFAIFGAGDIVSDPTSYTYYAKEIKTMNDQLTTALDTLDQMDKVNGAIDKANSILNETGGKILNPQKKIQGLFDSMKSAKSKFSRLANKVSDVGVDYFFKNYHNVSEPLKEEILAKWKDNYTALFDDKEDEKYQELNEKVLSAIKSNNYTKYQKATNDLNTYLKLKNIEKKALKKYSLMATMDLYNDYFMNEEVVEERKEQDLRIQKYIDQIKTAEDMHKQQQTTNLILIEMLDFIKSQYEMQMKFFNAMAMSGVTNSKAQYNLKDVIEQRKDYTNSKDAKVLITPERKILNDFIKNKIEGVYKTEIYQRLNGDLN